MQPNQPLELQVRSLPFLSFETFAAAAAPTPAFGAAGEITDTFAKSQYFPKKLEVPHIARNSEFLGEPYLHHFQAQQQQQQQPRLLLTPQVADPIAAHLIFNFPRATFFAAHIYVFTGTAATTNPPGHLSMNPQSPTPNPNHESDPDPGHTFKNKI